MLKRCRQCGLEAHNKQELKLFCKDSRKLHGYTGLCKECGKIRCKTYRENNPDRIKDSKLKYMYGITLLDLEEMKKEQQGCCKICGIHENRLSKSLFVDHCHTTGKVRGLLCHHCNTAIGFLKDDIALLDKVRDYLK